jgi:transcriptional regulator with XRE-family HTH domain
MTIDDVSHKVGLSPNELENYEMGETPIPLPILEALALDLNRPVKVFQDRQGPIGKWETQQRAIQSFVELSIELQTFVTKPINRPYLELAQRLSEMSVEKLRGVAEGLLEITL